MLIGLPMLLLVVAPLYAQDQGEPPMQTDLAWSQSGVVPGGEIVLAGIFDVPDNHHITDKSFGLFSLEPELPKGFSVVNTEFPEGDIDQGQENYRGTVAIKLTVHVDPSVAPGDYTVPVKLNWQLCRESVPEVCFLLRSVDLVTTISVLESGATPIPSTNPIFGGSVIAAGSDSSTPSASASSGSRLEDRLTTALQRGSLTAFLLVFLAGILISFTPCVYPMIPIIIGFVGSGAGGNRFKGFMLSLFFVIGLVITYSILGVVAGATGALFGAFMQNPIVLWFIVAVFLALGASMLGAFDITVPASIQGKLMGGSRKGFIGAVLIGGVTGIVAAPCAGPPLLVLLSWIGNTGNLLLGFALMATFAAGLGVLFIVIGTFAGAITALPKAGEWMETVKKGLGVVIFAVALYYIGLLIPHSYFTLLLGGFILFVGLFMGAARRWEELSTGGKYGKAIGILLVLAGAFYFLLGLAKVNDIQLAGVASPTAGVETAVADAGVPWVIDDHVGAMKQAMAEGKPVLIDFYADWCGVCVELEHKVWNQAAVIAATQGYIPLKLDFTRATPEKEALRKQYGVGGLPTVLILGPDGSERARFTSYKAPEEVAAWLNTHAG